MHTAEPLLIRSKQGVEPTEAGAALYRHAQVILKQLDDAVAEVGLSLDGHRSQGVSLPILRAADHLVVMSPEHEVELRRPGYARWSWRLTLGQALPAPQPAFLHVFSSFGIGLLGNAALPARGRVANPITVDTATSAGARYLTLTFPRRPVATDLTYTLESSTDLGIWSAVPGRSYTTGAGPITAEDSVAFGTAGVTRRFLRLRMSAP